MQFLGKLGGERPLPTQPTGVNPPPSPTRAAAPAAAAAAAEEEEEEEEAVTSTLVMPTRHAEDELPTFEEWFAVECPGELV